MNMRVILRALALILCALLALSPALAVEAPDAEDQKIIAPAQPVPDYVQALLAIARGELGYTEARNGETKYGVWSGDPTAEWCAEFLCWCVDQTDKQQGIRLLGQVYPNYSGTNTGRDWFLKQGRYIARTGVVPGWGSQWYKGEAEASLARNSYIPQPGDWVFFSNSASGDTTHVAMVEYCAYDDSGKPEVHVIEGNNPSSVARNTYPIDYWAILGYGTVYDLADVALRFGNSGEKVKALQRDLAAAGLLESQYVTGQYGALTMQAVTAFQKLQGLEQTGVANHKTQWTLRQYASMMAIRQSENGPGD